MSAHFVLIFHLSFALIAVLTFRDVQDGRMRAGSLERLLALQFVSMILIHASQVEQLD